MSLRTFTVVAADSSGNTQKADPVGTLVPMSDYERELAIARESRRVEFFMEQAERARVLRDCLIASRTPEQVARMEEALGLDMPACANEERA